MLRPPPGRLEHGGGLHAEEGGQGPAGVPEDLHPEVGDPGAGLLEGVLAAPSSQRLAGEADVAADASHQGLEGDAGGAGSLAGLDGAPQGFDERAAPENALVSLVGLPAPPEALDHRPAAQAPDEAASLEVGAAALGEPRGHEGAVGLAGPPEAGAELVEDLAGRLPRAGDDPEESTVAAPGVPLQGAEILDHAGAQGVQVEVADEFQEVGLLLHDNGFEPVLEQVAHPVVSPVEGPPQSGVRRLRMLRARARRPVRTRRWAWLGRRAQP